MVAPGKATNILVMMLREIFAQNLRRRRKELHISQEELASLASLDRTYVSALERSLYSISLDRLELVAKALDVCPGDLLRPTDDDHQDTDKRLRN